MKSIIHLMDGTQIVTLHTKEPPAKDYFDELAATLRRGSENGWFNFTVEEFGQKKHVLFPHHALSHVEVFPDDHVFY